MNTKLLFFLLSYLLSFHFRCHAQKNSRLIKISYQQGCSFCAEERFVAALYVYQDGAFYTYKHDSTGLTEAVEHTAILDTTTGHIRFDRKSDSIFQLGFLRAINPKGILIAEKRKTINWVLIDSVRIIDNHKCQYAIGDFRGRQYHAWYDPEVDLNVGPWKLHGLPGALIYAVDSTGELYFKAVEIEALEDIDPEEIVIKPDLPIVERLDYRAKREEVYERIKAIKPEAGSNVTYTIKLKKNYWEFE